MENSKEMKEWKEYYKKTIKNNPSESAKKTILQNIKVKENDER